MHRRIYCVLNLYLFLQICTSFLVRGRIALEAPATSTPPHANKHCSSRSKAIRSFSAVTIHLLHLWDILCDSHASWVYLGGHRHHRTLHCCAGTNSPNSFLSVFMPSAALFCVSSVRSIRWNVRTCIFRTNDAVPSVRARPQTFFFRHFINFLAVPVHRCARVSACHEQICVAHVVFHYRGALRSFFCIPTFLLSHPYRGISFSGSRVHDSAWFLRAGISPSAPERVQITFLIQIFSLSVCVELRRRHKGIQQFTPFSSGPSGAVPIFGIVCYCVCMGHFW